MCPSKFICFVFVFSLFQCSPGKDLPTIDIVKKWAEKINRDVYDLNNLHIVADEIYQKFDSTKGASIKYEEIHEAELVKEMAKTLSKMLLKKMEALNLSVIAAEAAVRGHEWRQELDIPDVPYYNTKTMVGMGVPEEYSDRFGKDVNFNFSSVHIPVEIYEGNIDILNGLNWTSQLDAQFKENFDNDPDILWQYFGSQSGFMRFYPATNWNTDGVDLYDVRRQSWYTQGSSSPKDMMILIDTSGSTYGQSLQLMKNAVKSILNTLGENDFVNVVEFSTEAKFVGKCFNHTAFVQANFRNKKQLEKDVDSLTAMGQADFSVAIKFAFEKFAEFSRNETDDDTNMGANCNKVIMLLTDGGTDNAEDVFEEFNWPNKSVRVFTYAVGPTPNPIHAVRWMACANRGYFSQIPAMGAIRARVQDYVLTMARPLALSHVEHTLWSSSHRSAFYDSHNPMGLGMMTTVTLPVYNNTVGSSNQTILGVMGVDVTTAHLEAQTPFEKIGPNGYSFAINPNGYVVFHPNLRTQGKFMKEPPNIDLLELEVEGDTPNLVELRTEMIKGDTSEKFFNSLQLASNRRYVTEGQATYAFIPIENTTFRLGISVPSYQKKYRDVTADINDLEWPNMDEHDFEIFVAPWKYHKNRTKISDLPKTLDDIINMLKTDDNPNNWHLQRLFNLYFDARVALSLKSYLRVYDNDTDTNDNDTESEPTDTRKAMFIMTSGGITLVHPANESDHFEAMRDLRKSSLYTRALYAPGCIIVADHSEDKRSNTSAPPYIDIACAVERKEFLNGKNATIDKPAVFGERISHEKVMDTVYDSIDTFSAIDQNFLTCRDEELLCYLLDDGGFVVATNREDHRMQVGRFLGQVDPPLMSAMNGTVYGRVDQFDFQAACKKTKKTVSAGFKSFTIPTLSLLSEFLSVGFWTNQITWLFSSFSVYSWLLTPTLEVLASSDDSEKECVKTVSQYFFNITSLSGEFDCDNCTRSFNAAKMASFNLLFVVSDPPCEECSELYPPVSQAPREISPEEEEGIICEMARNPRNRVQAYGCYHEDSREDQTECGCSSLKPSRWCSCFLAIVCIAWIWLSSGR